MGRHTFIALVGFAAMVLVPRAKADPISLQAAEDSLNGRVECVAFRWLNQAGNQSSHDGIAIPVKLNDKELWFQVDTGADLNVLYGDLADRMHWRNHGERIFEASELQVGTAKFAQSRIQDAKDMQPDTGSSGSLGLENLIGKIVVIDYPSKRFCIFDPTSIPKVLLKGKSASASLRNAKFFLPLKGTEFSSDDMIFDTGSSQFPVLVDLSNWIRLTGLPSPSGATSTFAGTSWGKSVEWKGARAANDLSIGPIRLGEPIIFTQPSSPDKFQKMQIKADGVIGNAPFEKYMVILNLTEWMTFNVIE